MHSTYHQCFEPPTRAGTHDAVLILGDTDHPEFQLARRWLRDRFEGCQISLETQRTCEPRALCVFQARAGGIERRQFTMWERAFPLAHWWLVLGSWCEGEMRSGRPVPGWQRLYWYEAAARLPELLLQSPLPRTRTSVDHVVDASTKNFASRSARPTLYIDVASTGLVGMVKELVESSGWLATTSTHSCTAWLIEGNDLSDGSLLAKARALHERWPSAPGMVLMNYPRWQEWVVLSSLGVRHIFGKPVPHTDLVVALASLAARLC